MARIRTDTLKSGKRYWRVIWTEQRGSRSLERSQSFDSFSEAKKRRAEVEIEIERRGIGDPFKMTVGVYLDRWLKGKVVDEVYSPSTIAGYRNYIVIAKKFLGDIRLAKLSPDDLTEAYREMRVRGGRTTGALKEGAERAERPLSKQSVLSVHKMLSKALSDACPPRSKLIAENPARGVAPPAPERSEVDQLTEAQMMAMWRAAQAKQAAGRVYNGIDLIVLLLASSGLRRSELLGICADSITYTADGAVIEVKRTVVRGLDGEPQLRERTKTSKSRRRVSVPIEVAELFRRHEAVLREQRLKWGKGYHPAQPLFPESDGGLMMPTRLTGRLYQVQKAAGVAYKSVAHAFRHTHISVLLNSGAPLALVSARAGHARVGITVDVYGHITEAVDQAAADLFAQAFRKAVSKAENAAEMPEKVVEISRKGR